ncbi:hypothetical protein [Phaeobacter inhibens]|uniref:hypothetical protein n=1 Tax=Phaeobacter inhibens TaxID=221822 RepID=UPI00076BB3B0|nr:hypothetical protein [Phaeobacter inhibens]KXF89772.1 hypothetical protein AT574_14285 [Phaeobacter inhibens]WHP69286.1 hypothetical protein QMZ01_03610 [Phaeobacter inhibens]
MPLKQPMNTGMKDGKLVIDMAEADALWNGLSQDQQFEAMCIMFQPLLDSATAMKQALENIRELNMTGTDDDGHRWSHSDLIEQEIVAALPAST